MCISMPRHVGNQSPVVGCLVGSLGGCSSMVPLGFKCTEKMSSRAEGGTQAGGCLAHPDKTENYDS